MRHCKNVILFCFTILIAPRAGAQPPSAVSTPAASAAATVASSSAPVTPTPIALVEIPSEAEKTAAELSSIEEFANRASLSSAVNKELSVLNEEIRSRQVESRRALSQQSSLDELRELEGKWLSLQKEIGNLNDTLVATITDLDVKLALTESLKGHWAATLDVAKSGGAPAETVNKASETLARLKKTIELLQAKKAETLKLQSRLFERSVPIDQSLRDIRQARNLLADNLFAVDAPPIWRLNPGPMEGQETIASRASAFSQYFNKSPQFFALHLIILIVLLGFFLWIKRTFLHRLASRKDLLEPTEVFNSPVLLAVSISSAIAIEFYSDAPDLLWLVFSPFLVITCVLLLRRVLHDAFDPIIFGLGTFYLIDLFRPLIGDPYSARLIFILELLAGGLFTQWLLKKGIIHSLVYADSPRLKKIAVGLSRFAVIMLAVSAVINAIGFVSLSNLTGNLILRSSYAALVVCAVAKVLVGLATLALEFPPLTYFRIVSCYRELLQRRTRRFIQYSALILWILAVVDEMSVRHGTLTSIRSVLNYELAIGSLSVSLASISAFGITVWAAFLLSRFIRFVLNEEIFPRASLSRGLPYAITTVSHYGILLVGFFLAMATLGLDMTKFVVLAGAFSVGLGFGLQNIINNFFSGLIVLFERPVRVGDVIQIGDVEGVVDRIGIRASFIRTVHGSEIIIPNAKLISEQVVNWTYSNRQRAIEIPLNVAFATDAGQVVSLLRSIAEKHPLISKDPAPEVVATKIGADLITFELRVYTDYFSQWTKMRSDLTLSIHEALLANKVAVR